MFQGNGKKYINQAGGTFIGIDWFSDNHDEFKQKRGQAEFIDECTCIFHEGYFAGLGMIHFFNEEQIQCLFKTNR